MSWKLSCPLIEKAQSSDRFVRSQNTLGVSWRTSSATRAIAAAAASSLSRSLPVYVRCCERRLILDLPFVDHAAKVSEEPQCVNPYFVLRALAAMEMLRELENPCRPAAGEPAIHADRSEDRRLNSQFADKPLFRCSCPKVCC